MENISANTRWIGVCCVGLVAALWTVGVVAAEPLRHFIQTLPIWVGVVLGLRNLALSKWVALPFFVFWLCLMIFIWLFLLGWAHVVSGTFSPTEIVLTLVIGVVSLMGIVNCIRLKSGIGAVTASAIFLLSAVLQFVALRVSLSPVIARR